MVSNIQYYLRRARKERSAAQHAVTEQARLRHIQLAEQFEQRAEFAQQPNSLEI